MSRRSRCFAANAQMKIVQPLNLSAGACRSVRFTAAPPAFSKIAASLIVRVETENGVEGWGEAHARAARQYLRDLGDDGDHGAKIFCAGAHRHGSGGDRNGYRQTPVEFASATQSPKPAIEIALFDALAKFYGCPTLSLLGGPYRREIELVGGLGMDLGPAKRSARERDSSSKMGFRTFKIKIGQQDQPERDRTGPRRS